jgi:hypothetical protein
VFLVKDTLEALGHLDKVAVVVEQALLVAVHITMQML